MLLLYDLEPRLLSVIDSFAENTVLSTNDSKAELITDNIEITINDVPMGQALTTGSDFQSSLPNSSGVSHSTQITFSSILL